MTNVEVTRYNRKILMSFHLWQVVNHGFQKLIFIILAWCIDFTRVHIHAGDADVSHLATMKSASIHCPESLMPSLAQSEFPVV